MEDIHINNIVATSTISDKLDLNLINEIVPSSEYDIKKFPGLIYRQKLPRASLLLFKSGKLVCTGAKTVKDVKIAILKIIKFLSKYKLHLIKKPKISIQNIVGGLSLHTDLNLRNLAISFGLENVEYEPEQFPALVYRVSEPHVVFLIFNSGEIVCTGAKKIEDITTAVNNLKDDLHSVGLLN